jgi:hypothetical protein
MSVIESLEIALLEKAGTALFNEAAKQALGEGVLKINIDSNGFAANLKLGSGGTNPSILIEQIRYDSKGVSGRIFIDLDDLKDNPLSVTLFDNFDIELTSFDLTILNNAFVETNISGKLTIPFFTDSNGDPKKIDVDLGVASDGSISVAISADPDNLTSEGLFELSYDIGNGDVNLTIHVSSIEIDKTKDGVWRILLSGNLLIKTAGVVWPTFELRGLGIDSNGKISLEGGWIDLPSQFCLDFNGFHVGLQRLGFGSDGDTRWIGFNGDIKLVDSFTLGGSLKGLRINLENGDVSFDGVAIAFEIPDTISIKGELNHIHIKDAQSGVAFSDKGLLPSLYSYLDSQVPVNERPIDGSPPKISVDVFAGQVSIVVEAIGGLAIDAHFIVGNFGGISVFFLAVGVELPTGIVIFSGVSLYGLSGLFASNLQPNPALTQHSWWEWYKFPAGGQSGINTSQAPNYSAVDVNKWMVPKQGALALGVGALIGTTDNGHTVSAAITIILMLPGPVLTFVGKANIISNRISGAQQEANFQSLAVYDGNAGTFDLAIDVQYSIPVVLEIEAHSELYVAPPVWFFSIGLPPREKRVRARIFDMFEVNAFFVVSNKGLITGSWVGYRNSWDFGPLSVKINAYMAMLLAIQWSPLQFAGGFELCGEVEIEAFGIGLGIVVDALLEGCAPNPFWVFGQFEVALELPWPLDDVGATVSLTYGGDDGSIPPPPLSLNSIGIKLSDHSNSNGSPSSDSYILLGHGADAPNPDNKLYDIPGRSGILYLPSLQGRQLPSTPSALPSISQAPIVPLESHFTITFAHPVRDLVGFINVRQIPPEIRVASLPPPSLVGKDDMSNLNPTPPSVEWEYRHSLVEVSLFIYDNIQSRWQIICSRPTIGPIGTTQLEGVWLNKVEEVQTQLKLFPYRLLSARSIFLRWDNFTAEKIFDRNFYDQDLIFSVDSDFEFPKIVGSGSNNVTGLKFTRSGASGGGILKIKFSCPVRVHSITSLPGGQLSVMPVQPTWSGDGIPLVGTSIGHEVDGKYKQLFVGSQLVSELSIGLSLHENIILGAIEFEILGSKAAILPEAPALYAIKTVTLIESGRVNGGSTNFQAVGSGEPIVEFAYFQTISGPGTTNPPFTAIASPKPNKVPLYPNMIPNGNQTALLQQSPKSYPYAGGLMDLSSYTQWSCPLNGSLAAYYGYDVNVEFTETYVNELYKIFSGGDANNSLHFRCFDRNHAHTILKPINIHVPSMPFNSAIVGEDFNPGAPPSLTSSVPQITNVNGIAIPRLLKPDIETALSLRIVAQVSSTEVFRNTTLLSLIAMKESDALLFVNGLDPAVATQLLKESQRNNACIALEKIWPNSLKPQSRYTLDVVAGPFEAKEEHRPTDKPQESKPSISSILRDPDPIHALASLQSYFDSEDELTSLQQILFTTSRYSTFSDQVSNVQKQLRNEVGILPIRKYKRVASSNSPQTWALNNLIETDRIQARVKYLALRNDLIELVRKFDPIADECDPTEVASLKNSNIELANKRGEVDSSWKAFEKASATCFDSLIAELGRADLASTFIPVTAPSPDTEMTTFLDPNGSIVEAILLEGNEPLQCRRIWQWTALLPLNAQSKGVEGVEVIWNVDGTRVLIIPQGALPQGDFLLQISFQGNIGAELPSITFAGVSVREQVDLGTITVGPVITANSPLKDRPSRGKKR